MGCASILNKYQLLFISECKSLFVLFNPSIASPGQRFCAASIDEIRVYR